MSKTIIRCKNQEEWNAASYKAVVKELNGIVVRAKGVFRCITPTTIYVFRP